MLTPKIVRVGFGKILADRPAPSAAGLQLGDRWITETGTILSTLVVDLAGVRSWRDVPGGGGASGPPDALGYFDPGGALTGDAKLTAIPVDQFGRAQIRDIRLPGAPGTGAVLRQGAWQVDGDPLPNVQGEGLVVYGPAPNGLMDGANGTIGRVKYDRFQIRLIQGGVDIGSAFRVDPTHLFLTDNTASVSFEVFRASGIVRARSYRWIEAAGFAGVATLLAGGTITIPNANVTAASRPTAFYQPSAGPPTGVLYCAAIVPGVSFTITSNAGAADGAQNIYWQLNEPG